MRYVDVQRRRREGQSQGEPGASNLWSNIERNPHLLITIGMVIGVLASLVLFFVVGPSLTGPPSPSLLITLIITSLILSFCVAVFGIGRLRHRGPDATRRPQFGGEKQLLMLLREVGGITPIQAALETSLTVDEAEGILSHLANRGHLHLESRDGTLLYMLPSSRSSKR
jgi:hypothetical protein